MKKKNLLNCQTCQDTYTITYNASHMNLETTISHCPFAHLKKRNNLENPNLICIFQVGQITIPWPAWHSCIDCAHVFVIVTLRAAVDLQAFVNVCVWLIKGAPEWLEMHQGWFLSDIWRVDNSVHRNDKTHTWEKRRHKIDTETNAVPLGSKLYKNCRGGLMYVEPVHIYGL